MTDDGVALTSMRHPPSEQLILKVMSEMVRGRCEHCRTPAIGHSPGYAQCSCTPQCSWTPPTTREQAIAAIFVVWDELPLDSVLDPDSLVTIERNER